MNRPTLKATSRKNRTELRQALVASEARFQAIVDRSADGVVVVSTDGAIRFVNPAAERLLGRSAQQLRDEVFGVPIVPGEVTEIELLPQCGQSRSAEMHVVHTRWMGQPAFLATFRDVTDRKRREEEAQEGVRQRDVFLATLSHELRNPLTAIVHSAQVLQHASDDPASVLRIAEVIDREGQLMARLLDDLLDVTRISRGIIALRRQQIDLRSVARAAADAMAPRMKDRNIHFHVAIDGDPLVLDADPARLDQILTNLLTNAARYGRPEGKVRMVVLREGEHAVVRVCDDGIGIAPERLESIFEPLQQGNVPLDRKDVGLGIGLSLVRSLTELHGGKASASSNGPECGSEFTIRLPLAAPAASLPLPQEGDSASPASRDLRILIVEDNGPAREMLHALLDLDGHHVAAAADAPAAMELLEFQQFDLALIDIGLPNIDGFQLARMIRTRHEHDSLLLIALTGYGQQEDRRRAAEAGFDLHLVKPLDFDAFNAILADRFKPVSQTSDVLVSTDR